MHYKDSENPMGHIYKSIEHADEAVALDLDDGYSWYLLGCARFAAFSQTGEWDRIMLLASSNAYQRAMSDEEIVIFADLIYDCALVHTFLENYESALKGFEDCSWADPPLEATKNRSMLIRLLNKLYELLQKGSRKEEMKEKSKCKISGTSQSSLTPSLSDINLKRSVERLNLDQLSEGFNKGSALIGKVVYSVKNENVSPLYYILCDSEEKHFVVTLHGILSEAMKEGDVVTLLEPYCRFVDFEWDNKRYQFKSIRVNFVDQLRVNGTAVSSDHEVLEPVSRKLVK